MGVTRPTSLVKTYARPHSTDPPPTPSRAKVWTHADGWDHVKGTPQITHGQVLDGGKSWDASFDFSLLPTVNFAMDSVFTYSYTVTNTYHSDAAWDSKSAQLCENGNAASNAVEIAQLAINVPFIKLSAAKQWGPYL